MKPRFGPLTERELDIAEWTFRATFKVLAPLLNAGIPLGLIEESVIAGDLRGRLRERTEAAS